MTTFEGPAVEEAEGIGALTLGGFLDEVVARFGPNEAVVLDDELRGGETVRWTYDDLGREAHRIARALIALDTQPGDAVGIVMGNRPEALAGIFGAALAGAVAVPVSTFAPPPELAFMLRKAEVRVVLTQARLLGRRFGDELAALLDELPLVRHVAVLGEPSGDELDTMAEATTVSDLARRRSEIGPDDPALVIFSSGTTSEPKGILHGHRSPTLQFWLQAQIFGRHPSTRMFSALPLFWTAGLNTAVGSTLAAGGCWVAQEVFEPAAALAIFERERVTEPYTLPHQTAALAEHADWATTDLSSVTCVYGKSSYSKHPTITPDPGWIMPVGYGMSETCAFVSSYRFDATREQVKVGSGHLLAGVRLRVVDPDDGHDLGVGEPGELIVNGTTRMLHYLGRTPEECFDADGFFHTGDVGHVDPDGVLHYSGRRTEMIKTGGANVSPAELEVALRANPAVKLSRIIGVPDARLDEIVVACIVRREGADASADDIRVFLRERVATYKVPKHVLFFDEAEMPMTKSATKVRDDELLALVRRRLDATVPEPLPETSRR